jgi:hypothetical protein
VTGKCSWRPLCVCAIRVAAVHPASKGCDEDIAVHRSSAVIFPDDNSFVYVSQQKQTIP